MHIKEKIYYGIIQKIDLYPIFLFFLTIILRTIFTNKLFTATAITGADEIGTIASAAYFAGYDWSGVISNTLYYGFGYSMLLAPVFMLFKNPTTIHHMLLLSNNILIALSGVIAYAILIKFFKMSKQKLAMLIACMTILYFPLSFGGNTLLNECMLQLLVWIGIYLLLLLNQSEKGIRKNVYTILLNLLLFYSLLVHSRSMVFIAAIVFTIAVIFLITRKSIVNPYIFYPVLAAGYFLSKICIKLVQNGLWLADSNTPLTNSTESAILSLMENIKYLFTYDGIKLYLFELAGQIYAMTILTYGIFAVSCVTITLFLRYYWKKRDICNKNNYYTNGAIIILFSVSGLVATLLLSSLTALDGLQKTWSNNLPSKAFLYYRYWSIYLTAIVMIGGYFLYRYRKLASKIILTSLILILSIIFVFNGYIGFRYNGQNIFSSGVYWAFASIGFWDTESGAMMTETSYFKLSLILLFVFAILCMSLLKKKLHLGYALVCLVMFINYAYGTCHFSIKISDALYEDFGEMVKIVDDSGYDSHYIYTSDNFSKYHLWLQYLFPRYLITNGIETEGNAIVITDQLTDNFFNGDWNIAYHNSEGEYLYENIYMFVKGNELADKLANEGYNVKKANLLTLTGYFVMPSTPSEYEIIGPIINGSVEQYFQITEEMSQSDFQLEILMATYVRTNTGTLRVEIIQGNKTLTYDINKYNMVDNDWLNISVYNHDFSSGEALVKITDLDNDIENCVTAYLVDTDQLGYLYSAGNIRTDNKKLFMRIKKID